MANFFDTLTQGISIPLSILASGYKPTGLIGKNVIPVAKSITVAGKIPIFGKDAFKIYQTYRARGAKSNRADIGVDSWLDFSCEEHDLAIPIDNRDIEALKALPVDITIKALFDIQNR